MTQSQYDDLRERLARSRAIRLLPGPTRPEDPREFGRRAAQKVFDRYVESREQREATEKS